MIEGAAGGRSPRRTRSTVGDAGKAILLSLNCADRTWSPYDKKVSRRFSGDWPTKVEPRSNPSLDVCLVVRDFTREQ